MRRLALLGALVALVAVGIPSAEAQQANWTVVELQPLTGASDAIVNDISNAGYAVGSSGNRPVIWNPQGVPTELPLGTGHTQGRAVGITEWGFIGGTRGPAATGVITGWFNGALLPVGGTGAVTDVSESGAMVGVTVISGQQRPFIRPLTGSVQFLLPTASGQGVANAVNRDGVTVGYDGASAGVAKAVRWARFVDRPLVPGYPGLSIGVDINNGRYSLVDLFVPPSSPTHRTTVVVAPGGAATVLGPVPLTQGVDLNESGVVVGTEDPEDGPERGVLFVYGTRVNLTSLVSAGDATEWVLDEPTALNDNAWVVGMTGNEAWLLKPPAG